MLAFKAKYEKPPKRFVGELICQLNKRLVLLISLALTVFLFVPSIPRAHAVTGVVCLTTAAANACPASPPAFGPFTIGTNFSIGIFIQNSNAMAGFDIYVKSDPAVLTPTSASLGPLIVNQSLTPTCVNAIAKTGSCPFNIPNGNAVAEVIPKEGSAGTEFGGISPCP